MFKMTKFMKQKKNHRFITCDNENTKSSVVKTNKV